MKLCCEGSPPIFRELGAIKRGLCPMSIRLSAVRIHPLTNKRSTLARLRQSSRGRQRSSQLTTCETPGLQLKRLVVKGVMGKNVKETTLEAYGL